ncbi:GntR family transcriptional regulator [Jiella sonneratiae]|uniref:GntR family transcriptional regulator n=1 Tax=Jiella sonneratiae TaxID=2816856 RepID=A0ABS3J1I5_9HYPH|nr:GntR family transcriptional regulator [Jiella sonneratiae]MBO0903531.1 GntR family transcriptional regulator [Jiella sonneratiae]
MIAKDAVFGTRPEDRSPRDAILQRPSLGDEVYQRLVDDLIALRIPAGARLSVDGLARRFGVSQTPTRAALIRLEAEGLVVKKQFTGWSVAPLPSPEQFAKIFELRCLIEPASAAGAARLASPEALAELGSIAEEMRAMAAEDITGHRAKLVVLDSRFHSAIAAACGNELIEDALGRLFTQMHIFRLRYHSDVAQAVIEEHIDILAAIGARDPARAETAMRGHIEAGRERIEAHLDAAD